DQYKRPADVPALLGDSTKAKKVLNWKPKVKFKNLVHMMLVADIKIKFEQSGIVPVDPQNRNSDDFYIEKAIELAQKLRKK
ncbi:uncharacterized protein METZ01_LOCUS515675, partial [marine metagenome]